MNKRVIALALCVLTVFASFGYCFATEYNETNGVGQNKIITNFDMLEQEGFKVSVPATGTISWFTGSLEQDIIFSDVILGPGHQLDFGIDTELSDYDEMNEKFTLINQTDQSKKVMLDITYDGTNEFSADDPLMFSFTDPVDREEHKIKFTIDKTFVNPNAPSVKYIPETGVTYKGKITYFLYIS